MSFVDGFFTFNIDLSNVENNIYKKLLFKICKHPNEEYENIISKAIVYCHAYKEGLDFSQGTYSPQDPTMWEKDILDNVHMWIQIGAPSYKKLHKAIKQNNDAEFRVYFNSKEEIQDFCYEFRAIKTKDFQKVKFYLIDSEFIEKLTQNVASRMNWNLNIVDYNFYLNWEKLEFEGKVQEIDIWKEYQEQIANA